MNDSKIGESVKYLQQLEKQRESFKGKKRKRFDELSKRNKTKLLRNSGQTYVSKSNKLVDGKIFQFCTKCCSKGCHLNVKEEDQKFLFEYFWNLANYNKQNYYLFGLMNRKNTSKSKCFVKWNYHVNIKGDKINVCLAFFMVIFQVTPKRLRTLQSKIINGKSFDDERGHHESTNQIPTKTWELFSQFIEQFPKKSVGKYYKLYFEDSSMTKTSLYNNFCKLLNERNIKLISYWSFRQHFYEKFDIGFSNSKKDVKNYYE